MNKVTDLNKWAKARKKKLPVGFDGEPLEPDGLDHAATSFFDAWEKVVDRSEAMPKGIKVKDQDIVITHAEQKMIAEALSSLVKAIDELKATSLEAIERGK